MNDNAVRLFHTARQLQRHPQPTLAQVLQADFAAMAVGDVAGNAQAQAITLLLPGEAEVRFEDLLQALFRHCLLYTSPSPRDQRGSRMPSSA